MLKNVNISSPLICTFSFLFPVADTQKSIEFYMNTFGCIDISQKRDLPYPGAFLLFGKSEIHLMQLPNPDITDGRPAHGGRDRHIALSINNIDEIKSRLEDRKVNYTLSQSGRRALFCRDLDGNSFEFVEDTSLV